MPDERFMRHHYGASGYVDPRDRKPTAEDTLKAIEKIIDDHTDYEGPMPATGDYIGGVDPGALDLIVDLLRAKGGWRRAYQERASEHQRRAIIRKALEDPVAHIVVGWLPGENEAVVMEPAELIALLDMADEPAPVPVAGGESE